MIFINRLAGIRRFSPANLQVIRNVHKNQSDTRNSEHRSIKYMKYTTIGTGVMLACAYLYLYKTIVEMRDHNDELILENERLKIANAELKCRLAEQ